VVRCYYVVFDRYGTSRLSEEILAKYQAAEDRANAVVINKKFFLRATNDQDMIGYDPHHGHNQPHHHKDDGFNAAVKSMLATCANEVIAKRSERTRQSAAVPSSGDPDDFNNNNTTNTKKATLDTGRKPKPLKELTAKTEALLSEDVKSEPLEVQLRALKLRTYHVKVEDQHSGRAYTRYLPTPEPAVMGTASTVPRKYADTRLYFKPALDSNYQRASVNEDHSNIEIEIRRSNSDFSIGRISDEAYNHAGTTNVHLKPQYMQARRGPSPNSTAGADVPVAATTSSPTQRYLRLANAPKSSVSPRSSISPKPSGKQQAKFVKVDSEDNYDEETFEPDSPVARVASSSPMTSTKKANPTVSPSPAGRVASKSPRQAQAQIQGHGQQLHAVTFPDTPKATAAQNAAESNLKLRLFGPAASVPPSLPTRLDIADLVPHLANEANPNATPKLNPHSMPQLHAQMADTTSRVAEYVGVSYCNNDYKSNEAATPSRTRAKLEQAQALASTPRSARGGPATATEVAGTVVRNASSADSEAEYHRIINLVAMPTPQNAQVSSPSPIQISSPDRFQSTYGSLKSLSPVPPDVAVYGPHFSESPAVHPRYQAPRSPSPVMISTSLSQQHRSDQAVSPASPKDRALCPPGLAQRQQQQQQQKSHAKDSSNAATNIVNNIAVPKSDISRSRSTSPNRSAAAKAKAHQDCDKVTAKQGDDAEKDRKPSLKTAKSPNKLIRGASGRGDMLGDIAALTDKGSTLKPADLIQIALQQEKVKEKVRLQQADDAYRGTVLILYCMKLLIHPTCSYICSHDEHYLEPIFRSTGENEGKER
jgi:hypothetical protein